MSMKFKIKLFCLPNANFLNENFLKLWMPAIVLPCEWHCWVVLLQNIANVVTEIAGSDLNVLKWNWRDDLFLISWSQGYTL